MRQARQPRSQYGLLVCQRLSLCMLPLCEPVSPSARQLSCLSGASVGELCAPSQLTRTYEDGSWLGLLLHGTV